VNPVRDSLTVALLLCVAIDTPTYTQQRTTRVEPIPAVERFVQGTGLRVRLTVAKASVAAFEDPGFVVHFITTRSTF